MKPALHKVSIKDVRWGARTHVADGVLYVNKEETVACVAEAPLKGPEADRAARRKLVKRALEAIQTAIEE